MPSVPLIAPDPDAATAYPGVARLHAALEVQDWPAVAALFDDIGWDGYSLLMWEASAVQAAYGFLSAQASEESPEPLATVLFAAQLIQTGWRARTAAAASQDSAQQFALLHDHLRRADQLLEEVTTADPGHVVAWELRLVTARGLELGLDEARRRYDQLVPHAPHHLPAQEHMVQQLCPKWGGTFEQMHAFAQECARAAPEGSPNAVLVAHAHIEHAFRLDGHAFTDYLRHPRVWQEIREAAERSVWHTEYRGTYGWVAVHNTFALAFSLTDDPAAAANQFAAVGHLVGGFFWDYLGDPRRVFHEHRKQALANASRPAAALTRPAPAPQSAPALPSPRQPAGPPGAGNLIGILATGLSGAFFLICAGSGVWLAITDPEEFEPEDWVFVVGSIVVAIALLLGCVLLWRHRRRGAASAGQAAAPGQPASSQPASSGEGGS